MKPEMLEEILLRFLKSKDAVAAHLQVHKGKIPEEILQAAMESAQIRKVVRRKMAGMEERAEIAELRRKMATQDWNELLIQARAMVLCGLPYKKTDLRQITKSARLGSGQRLSVTFTALGTHPIPYGRDRAVLAWITTCASRTGNPKVQFDSAMEFMRAFDLTDAGPNYKYLRECMDRLKSFSCYITVNNDDSEASSQNSVVRQAILPSRIDMKHETRGEMRLPMIQRGFYVELDPTFFEEIQKHGVPIPLDLMKRYASNPLAWDFITFLNYRTRIGKTPSRIPMEVLAGMIGTANPNLRRLRFELDKILDELREIWPELPAKFEGRGLKAVLYVAPPKNGAFLVSDRNRVPALGTLPEPPDGLPEGEPAAEESG